MRSIVGDGVLPDGLEEVVARALAKEPAERFGSAAAFDEALARVQAEASEGAESIEIERTASACPPTHAGCCEAQASLAAWTCFEYTRAVEAAGEATRLNHAWSPLKLLMSLVPSE